MLDRWTRALACLWFFLLLVNSALAEDDTLLETMCDPTLSWVERREAASALAEHRSFAVDRVLAVLRGGGQEDRMLAALSLQGAGREAVPPLLQQIGKDEVLVEPWEASRGD